MSETNGKTRTAPHTEDVGTDYPGAFPNSKKVFVEGSRGIRVPMREIQLTGGEPPLRVYDTSGPGEIDVRLGLPTLRDEWILGRGDVTASERMRTPTDVVEMPEGLARRTLRVQAAHQQPTLQPPRRALAGEDAQCQDKQAREGRVIHRRLRDETESRDPHGPRDQQAGKVKQG